MGLDGSNLNVRRAAEDLSLPAQSLVALVSGDSDTISGLDSQPPGSRMSIQDRYGVPALCRVKHAPQAAIGATGLIDREYERSLARMDADAAGEFASPEGELESTIAGIWQKVLNVEQLGVTENFFDLGGSSLAMGQAHRLMQEILKRRISMTEMFQYSTVRALAAHLSQSDAGRSMQELGKSQSRGELRRQRSLARRRG